MRSTLFVLLIGLFLFVGCEEKDVPDDVTQVLTTGSWRISHYMDNGGDETGNFIGFSFQFNGNGTLTALKNGITKNGTWTRDNSSNKLIIDLGPNDASNQPVGELTDDWKVGTFSNTQISLFDESNASEMLVFQKN